MYICIYVYMYAYAYMYTCMSVYTHIYYLYILIEYVYYSSLKFHKFLKFFKSEIFSHFLKTRLVLQFLILSYKW